MKILIIAISVGLIGCIPTARYRVYGPYRSQISRDYDRSVKTLQKTYRPKYRANLRRIR